MKMERKIANKANRAGAALYRKEVKKGLTKTSGKLQRGNAQGVFEDVHLKDRIGIQKTGGSTRIEHIVGYVGLARAYGHVREFGSRYQSGNRLWTRTLQNKTQAIFNRMKEVISKELEKV